MGSPFFPFNDIPKLAVPAACAPGTLMAPVPCAEGEKNGAFDQGS